MPRLRQNIATKEWVIIATERARRPEDFAPAHRNKSLSSKEVLSPSCPFCPGNEKLSPEEITTNRDSDGRWLVRVVANKYPALAREGTLDYHDENSQRWMNGVGVHDVIIEAREHNLTTALLDHDQIVRILQIYRIRYLAASDDERVELVTLFKNHGAGAGTSLEHPHSQMIASPVVPAHIRDRIAQAMHYYDDHRQCVFCRMLEDERRSGDRIVHDSKHFVAFVLYAALSPFHIWVLPKRHISTYPELSQDEIYDLAGLMKTVLLKINIGLGDPDFNYVIRSLPGTPRTNAFFHCYISIIPRVTMSAGFELGSGMYINTALPEKSADFLRNIKI
jgi:UDPglucose--hexose-1-phosphate uridylyltransferase